MVAGRLPECERGSARVDHLVVHDEKQARWLGFLSRTFDARPGTYARLFVGGRLVMSDAPWEHRTNAEFLHRARSGSILIAGLGIGMILPPVLEREAVTAVTVVEVNQDVIDLVSPSISHPKLVVVCGDINTWRPARGTKYDTIYFDIWPDVCSDYLPQVARLHQAFKGYKNRANPDAWMGSWQHDAMRHQRARGSF